MLSRVAESLYWFSRYVRRAENTARLVGVNSQLQLDLPRSVRFAWQPLLDTLGAGDAFRELHPGVAGDGAESDVVHFLLLDERNPNSMLNALKHARDGLRSIRDVLPQELWERVNGTYLWVGENGERALARRYRMDLINRVVDDSLTASGILTANVSHDIGFQFLRLGTALEQADMTTRIIDAGGSGLIRPRAADELDAYRATQWMSVLRSLAAYQMYRRHVRQRVTPALALEFLLQNREFPRSVAYCLERMRQTLPSLPPARVPPEPPLAATLGLALEADTHVLVECGTRTRMDHIQIGLGDLHDAIRASYFPA
ncbi:MAG TPA: alpha-E domain-containing protein [Dokdonella sp.]